MKSPRTATITYLHHSGFAIETADTFLIFDYYQPFAGISSELANGIITGDFLRSKSHVYVFSSHRHRDHFDPVILDWARDNPAITYILSDDIHAHVKNAACQRLGPYQEWRDDRLEVRTFGSTDEGVSFLVNVDGLAVFHAGDLNWWHWKEDTRSEQARFEREFKAEIAKIAACPIDIAFFPVDRRLEEFYAIGAEYLAHEVRPKLLIPMHFGTDFGASAAFSARAKETGIPTVAITHKGQEILFNNAV